jgi:hypothetical protein
MFAVGSFAEIWAQVWAWIAWGNSQLRDVLAYATFIGVMYQIVTFWRTRRLVTIIAANRDSPSDPGREIAKVPASFASRAEIVGLVAQAAGGERLDFSGFAFDYKFRRQVVVQLPADSFEKLSARR